MRKSLIAAALAFCAGSAAADGCGGQAYNYKGVWLNETGQPTANYTLSLDAFAVGGIGCYWIAATPSWDIPEDVTHVARITDTNLDGGILIAVGSTTNDLNTGNHAWVWIKNDQLSATSFSEMYFNRQTRGIPR